MRCYLEWRIKPTLWETWRNWEVLVDYSNGILSRNVNFYFVKNIIFEITKSPLIGTFFLFRYTLNYYKNKSIYFRTLRTKLGHVWGIEGWLSISASGCQRCFFTFSFCIMIYLLLQFRLVPHPTCMNNSQPSINGLRVHGSGGRKKKRAILK